MAYHYHNHDSEETNQSCSSEPNLASTLPFRFRAGGSANMAPDQASHHHRSTTKAANKPFKAKHLTKGAQKEKSKGKVESLERGQNRTPRQHALSKLDRRNQAKQKRLSTNSEHVKSNSIFSGASAAARITAVVPLCNDIDVTAAIKGLVESVDLDATAPADNSDWQLDVTRFKQRIRFITADRRNVWETLDICRAADFVLFVLSPEVEVDAIGEQLLRCIEGQGVSTVLTTVQNLSSVGVLKKQHLVQDSLKSYITHFFATQERVHSLDSRQECANVMRSLCTTTPKGIRWREDRSWMLVEDVAWADGALQVTGVVRGRGLNPDRLAQLGDWGDFQIDKMTVLPSKTNSGMALDTSSPALETAVPTDDRDELIDLAPEEVVMQEAHKPPMSVATADRRGVLLDDHHYFEDDHETHASKPQRLPKGTSDYQAAWFLDDVSLSGSDMESVDGDDVYMQDGVTTNGDGDAGMHTLPPPTECGQSDYPQSEAFQDASPEDEQEQLAAFRASKRQDAKDDLEFPDEIELEPNVLARERLARYRGLKSLRSSTWDTEEDRPHEPEEWHRLLEVSNYKAARNRVVNEALAGGIAPGSRVVVHLNLANHDIKSMQTMARPRTMFVLLRHEHKRTAMNCSINLSSEYPEPLKSKEEIILQCGPRRLVIAPLYSQGGNTPNNVSKFERYVHPGMHAVASFLGPVMWGSMPVLYLKKRTSSADVTKDVAQLPVELIATGTSLAPSTNRVIAKRVVLTGHPYKIHKRVVTIRYMFFNNEDVEWFRALELWTKRGRSGLVKESLGTHGYFKATFDAKINPLDAVAVSLYKRVWPRTAQPWRPESM